MPHYNPKKIITKAKNEMGKTKPVNRHAVNTRRVAGLLHNRGKGGGLRSVPNNNRGKPKMLTVSS